VRPCESCLRLAEVIQQAEGGDVATLYRAAHRRHLENNRRLALLASLRTVRQQRYRGRRVEDVDLPP
jgi:hypothetical protein